MDFFDDTESWEDEDNLEQMYLQDEQEDTIEDNQENGLENEDVMETKILTEDVPHDLLIEDSNLFEMDDPNHSNHVLGT